jgi:hypothetical protein
MNSDFARGAVRGAAQSRLVTWPAITSPRSRTDLGAILTKFFRDFEAIPRAYGARNEALKLLGNSVISLRNLAIPHLVIAKSLGSPKNSGLSAARRGRARLRTWPPGGGCPSLARSMPAARRLVATNLPKSPEVARLLNRNVYQPLEQPGD